MENGLTLGPTGDEAELAHLVGMVESSEETTVDARRMAERNRDYYDNYQLSDEERAALKKRKQPLIIKNRIKRKIDYLRGVEVNQRTDPKAYPRTPKDQDAAEAVTDALRFVCDEARFDIARSGVWFNQLVEGCGAAEVIVTDGRRGPKIEINHIPWDRLIYDPYSRLIDFSDAKFLGIVLWMDYEDVLNRWKGRAEHLELLSTETNSADTYDDRPKHNVWSDKKRKRVKVIALYYQKSGVWNYAEFTKGGFLSDPILSPYLNEDGEPECPIIATSAYIDRENNRYSPVNEMISSQDEINKRSSKALHLINVNQIIMDEGAVEDERVAREEAAKPDGLIRTTPGLNFKIERNVDLAQGQLQLLQEAKEEIDLLGPNAAMQGKQGGAPSGRAINLMQQGGMIELGPLVDARRQWDHAVYRSIWNRVRQFWNEEKWVRVTDNENSTRFVGLNVPAIDEFGQPVIQNPVAEVDVDILLEDIPDVVNLQAENFEQITKMVQSGMVQFPPATIIKMSGLPNQKDLLKSLENPGAAQQQEDANLQKQIALDTAASKIQKTHAETRKANADASKVEMEVGIGQASVMHQSPIPSPPQEILPV